MSERAAERSVMLLFGASFLSGIPHCSADTARARLVLTRGLSVARLALFTAGGTAQRTITISRVAFRRIDPSASASLSASLRTGMTNETSGVTLVI